ERMQRSEPIASAPTSNVDMSALRSLGIAVFVAIVTAASVVWYIDYKVNQAVEAVMAPVHATTEKVGDTIAEVEQTVDVATSAVDATLGQAGDYLARELGETRDDLALEWDNARDLSAQVGDWIGALGS
ncbi:MAG: hypothetical protein WAL25_08900, partial [Acidimicrobiia bacterium]